MANALAQTIADSSIGTARSGVKPYWNPYVVGVILGLVLLATYLVTGRGLGATGAFSSVTAWLASFAGAEHVAGNPVHSRYLNDGAPLLSWTLFLLIGAFIGAYLSGLQAGRVKPTIERGPRISDSQRILLAVAGGFLAAFGAKIAHGCTSGQALTGGSILNVGSLVFMLAVFASAYALAYFLRKEWI
jgi:uncharacterized membrane protein YedE/YeeE